MSLGKNIGGVSIGAEVSYRHNTPLNAQVLGVAPGLPGQGDTKGPRGDTWHGVVNALGTIAEDAGVRRRRPGLAELHLRALDQRDQRREPVQRPSATRPARPPRPRPAFDKWDGCATKNYVGIGVAFTPTWFQVFPGVDLSAPLTYAVGLNGNVADDLRRQPGPGQLQRRRRRPTCSRSTAST